MADDGASFGTLLRRLRVTAGLTLDQLAEASGVTGRAISDMERGVSRRPRVSTVQLIADGLRLDPDQRAALAAAARAPRPPAVVGGLPLPRAALDFTGRDDDLARIAGWAELTPALVVISGAPGIGKTSLAVQAAQAWTAEERLFVDLRGLDTRPLTPDAVLGRLIRAVSPAQRAVPRKTEEAAALWHSLVRERRLVVVLDNAVDEDQVRPVIPPNGPVVVLVTSRRRLSGLVGVHRVRLDALPDPDALTLLTRILDEDSPPEGLRRIAELCVNVPLALRIAGNRLASRPGWTPEDLIVRLAAQERRLDALTAGDLRIEAAFTLSYEQLSGIARRLFRRLALVAGPSTGTELAGVLVGEPAPVTETALDELVELSLLQLRPDGRFEFHDLLRLYARVQLGREESAAERERLTRRRDVWLLDTATMAGRFFEPEFHATRPDAAVAAGLTTEARAGDWLRAEAENWLPALRQAAEDGDDRRVVDVAESLHWFSDGWASWPQWEDVFTLSSRAAERLDDDALRAVHLGYLAWVHIVCLRQPEQAIEPARRALECAVRSGDRRQIAWAEYYAAWASHEARQWSASLEHARAAVAGFRATGDREGLPNGLTLCAMAVRGMGSADDAVPLFEDVIEAVTDPATAPSPRIALYIVAGVRGFLTEIEVEAERWPAALRRAGDSIAAAERLEQPHDALLTARVDRALVHARLGETASGRADLEAARELLAELGAEAPRLGPVRARMAELERQLGPG
ncbi:helix-turn-helix domain-containing protein [Actinoplanes sp. NPDC048796]|uniref:ATP-binding protein n=1 Tax=Actinoplanes sp. NPDC048796 TaxID=3155640 RepID=UPI003403F5EB